MVLQMKVEAVNFRKSQEISLLWLDCFITKFRNKQIWVGEVINPHQSQIGLKLFSAGGHFTLLLVSQLNSILKYFCFCFVLINRFKKSFLFEST